MSDQDTLFDVQELAELGGVSRRTVRYYVQRGLLPTPTGTGRGKHYTREHLDTLIRIRELQEAGVSLTDIAAQLGGAEPDPQPPVTPAPPSASPTPAQAAWLHVALADGVELHLERRRALDSRTLERLRTAVLAALQADDEEAP